MSKVGKQVATSQVAEAIAQRIIQGMQPGEQLESEAALAAAHEVSRVTIREALKILAGRGLVQVQRGRRAEVRHPDGSTYGEFLTSLIKSDPRCLFDLVEVRRSLEIQSVILAAKSASRSGLVAVGVALSQMKEIAEGYEAADDPLKEEMRFHRADVGFHEALALAGGNRVLIYLFEGMMAPLVEAFSASRRGQKLRGHSLIDSYESHLRIFNLVSKGDAKAAASAMQTLLNAAEADLKAAFGPTAAAS
ncbi:MAG: FCD domain-containing protein [Hyphomicrobiales bacterium]